MLDSLVRVSRRDGYNHFVHITMLQIPKAPEGVTLLLNLQARRQRRAITPEGYLPNSRLPRHKIDVDLHTPTIRITKAIQKIDANNTGCNQFPFSDFRHFLTLFSKFFPSFPHGTCSLSVSRPYLALEGIYLPI
jgi:hypothetical protein